MPDLRSEASVIGNAYEKIENWGQVYNVRLTLPGPEAKWNVSSKTFSPNRVYFFRVHLFHQILKTEMGKQKWKNGGRWFKCNLSIPPPFIEKIAGGSIPINQGGRDYDVKLHFHLRPPFPNSL
jgi:hypothetical protein